MADGAKARWLIRGTGHWVMTVMAWLLTLLAGNFLMKAIRGEGDWVFAVPNVIMSVLIWIVVLRRKQGQG